VSPGVARLEMQLPVCFGNRGRMHQSVRRQQRVAIAAAIMHDETLTSEMASDGRSDMVSRADDRDGCISHSDAAPDRLQCAPGFGCQPRPTGLRSTEKRFSCSTGSAQSGFSAAAA